MEDLVADSSLWPSKVKKMRMRVTIDAIQKETKDGTTTVKGQVNKCRRHLSDLINVWEQYFEACEKCGPETFAATLTSITFDIEECDGASRRYRKNTGEGILGKIKYAIPLFQDTDTKRRKELESLKENLIAERKTCQRIVSALQEKKSNELSLDFNNQKIEKNEDDLRQQKKCEEEVLNDISHQTKELSMITNDINWEQGWRHRRVALEEKVRGLQADLEENERIALEAAEIWERGLERRGLDKATKENRINEKRVDIEAIGKQLISGDKRVNEAENVIQKQRDAITENEPKVEGAEARLNEVRFRIEEIKGPNLLEDKNFDIDKTTDARGFTILQISAQNNDFDTAKLCLRELGASPNIQNQERLTAIDYSYFFGFNDINDLILHTGGSLPTMQVEALKKLNYVGLTHDVESAVGWHEALKVADTAARPAETLMEHPEVCENDIDTRMPIISDDYEQQYTGFEACLSNSINSDQVRRVVLLSGAVNQWLMRSDESTVRNFVDIIEGLKPVATRRSNVEQTVCHRRAIVGTAITFELLASSFQESTQSKKVVLFSPFVGGETDGVSQVGILVWSVCSDGEASMYKTLIANTEVSFMP